jgi:hypothetical protein
VDIPQRILNILFIVFARANARGLMHKEIFCSLLSTLKRNIYCKSEKSCSSSVVLSKIATTHQALYRDISGRFGDLRYNGSGHKIIIVSANKRQSY